MKRRFTILTAAIALLAFLAIPMGMRGQTRGEASVTFSTLGYSNSQSLDGTTINLDQNISCTFNKGTGSNPPAYYNTGTAARLYGGNTLTVTPASGSTITGMTLTFSSTGYTGSLSASDGTYTLSSTTGTWTGSSSSAIVITNTASSGHARLQRLAVTYTTSGTPTCATPTFNPAGGTYTQSQTVAISCATENATIYYTTNGDDPTASSSVYSAPLAISETTTIKAMATATGYSNSSVASATYTITTPSTIAEVRAQGTGSVFTQGIVTSCVGTTGYIQDNTAAICVYGSSLTVGDEITVSGNLSTYNGLLEIINPQVSVISSGNTINPEVMTIAEINASTNQGWYIRIEEATVTNISGSGNSQNTTIAQGNNTVVVRGNLGTTVAVNDIISLNGNIGAYNGVQIANPQNVEVQQNLEPSVTVTPATINAPAEGAEGTLAITYENIPDLISFDYYFCNAEGEELEEDPDWIYAEIQEENDTYSLYYLIDANDGEARTAYLKIYTFEDNTWEEVYDIVTVNQTEYVVDYAELPFEWSSFDEIPTGITNNGVTINNYLKFDTSGDNIILKFNERPGTLEFEVKGNPGNNGWAGTFKVQTSVDGVSYTDLQTYTELPTTEYQPESFATLDENVRYIKWVYTEKVSGNVAVNYIYLAAYEAPVPAITVESTTITATAEETEGSLNVTYTAIETDLGIDIYWFESDGTTAATEPAWILAEVNSELNVDYVIEANNGEARTAYFKLYGLDGEANSVYSELVTITQAAAPQQYTLTVEPFENLEIITFVDDEMVLETAGEIQVNEGAHIMLSIVADEGYVMETLMVNGVNHVNDIAEDFTYTFDMPAENVTISATAVENVAPAGGNYVRIASLDQLTDGSKVIIAARHDEEHTNGYYAMPGQTSGKPVGVAFTSETSGNDEILPATITASEDTYYWTVNVTNDGYTFTNAENQMIGYTSGTNFANGGNYTEWTISIGTAAGSAMVGGYTGFVIRNGNTNTRAFAFNGTAFGAYATSNMTGSGYNFFLDFFVQTEVEPESYPLDIIGYEEGSTGGYHLIASPVTVDPADVEGMTEGTFDLYYFDENQELEWINYTTLNGGINQNFGNLTPGKGYLYAKQATTPGEIFHFELTGTPYTGNGKIGLQKTEGAGCSGVNLVGNPYGEDAFIDRDFYTLNDAGSELMTSATSAGLVNAMQGVFVIASSATDTVTFSTQTPAPESGKIVMNVSRNNGIIDRAIVRFGQGGVLPKFQLNENSTKLYIVEGENEYAVVRSANEDETPVSFKAAENGTYTLSINAENVDVEYLHLIDNMTGSDVDLLATPSYTFEASTTDYADRFNLVYATTNSVSENGTSHFAFFNGSEWSINNTGEATLQVVDMMGRIIRNESINGNANINLNEAAGVYVIRLVNGSNVKVQKVVVK